MAHWQEHLPPRYQAMEHPEAYFTRLGEEADRRYLAIRDGLLDGVSPNNGTIGWPSSRNGWPRPTRRPGRSWASR